MTLEWEYACRGGPMTDPAESAFHFYLDRPANELRAGQANFGHVNSRKKPCKVGSYPANRLGLHDMHGNVAEWCHASELSPHGVPSPVVRGGAWNSTSTACRAENVKVAPPWLSDNSIGLRLVRVYVGK
jgi:formylglycine-generating enzyme required for sulfatase activity